MLGHLATVEPLLRATASAEIDATLPVEQVADRLEELAGRRWTPRRARQA